MVNRGISIRLRRVSLAIVSTLSKVRSANMLRDLNSFHFSDHTTLGTDSAVLAVDLVAQFLQVSIEIFLKN